MQDARDGGRQEDGARLTYISEKWFLGMVRLL